MEHATDLCVVFLADLVQNMISHVEHEIDGGTGNVQDMIGLLCLSRRGLLESEMWELIKMHCAATGIVPRAYRSRMAPPSAVSQRKSTAAHKYRAVPVGFEGI